MKKICVIGSLNVDLVIRLPRFHAPGETITAISFDTFTGGKGGNQAIAAAKLGASVLMVGKLGTDNNGAFYRQVLRENNINQDCVESIRDIPSGTAIIEVDSEGENRIAIVSGTNALVDREQIDDLLPRLLTYDIFLFQLEIPMSTVYYAAKLLQDHGKCIILDPAPAIQLPEEMYASIDFLTPNATELAILSGLSTNTPEEAEKACKTIVKRGTRAVIAKLGARGCMYVDSKEVLYMEGFSVKVVDTIAAGDSFNAGLAVAFAKGCGIGDAMKFANAVGALSTTAAGAQSAMPSMEQVDYFLAKQ